MNVDKDVIVMTKAEFLEIYEWLDDMMDCMPDYEITHKLVKTHTELTEEV